MLTRILFAVTLLIAAVPSGAQSWDRLQSLAPGDRVRVLDTDGRHYSGVWTDVTIDAISFRAGSRAVSLERPRVRRVEVRSTPRRLRRVLIWAGIGVAIGVVVDQTLGTRLRNEGNDSGRAAIYLGPTGVLGGIAAAFPAYRTTYRAP
jgi:hypothetical protein